jgi:type IV secretion system protein TrbL
MVLAALSLLALGIFGPAIANGIVSGGPQLGAGAAVATGVAAGGIVAAGAAGAVAGAGAAGSALGAAARGGASIAAAAGGMSRAVQGGMSGIASSLRPSAGTTANAAETGEGAASVGSASAGAPPAWAARMRRSQTLSRGASAATHAVRAGDHAGGGASVDLSESER